MKILELTGYADDLLCTEKDGQIKSIGVVKLHNNKDVNDEPCDLNITLTSFSTDGSCTHKTIDKILGHKICFTLAIID